MMIFEGFQKVFGRLNDKEHQVWINTRKYKKKL